MVIKLIFIIVFERVECHCHYKICNHLLHMILTYYLLKNHRKLIIKNIFFKLMATYKDPAFDASATVVYKNVNGIKSAQYVSQP